MIDPDDHTLTWRPDGPLLDEDSLVLSAAGSGADARVVGDESGSPEWLLALERFRVHEVIGRGGGGVVYGAFDRQLGVEVALKTLPQLSSQAQRALKREFRSLSEKAYHRNLVALYELFVDDEGRSFFTMERIEGRDLFAHVRREGGLGGQAVKRLLRSLRQLVEALSAIHGVQLIHRDIKPSNLLISAADERLVVVDFGLAAAQEAVREGTRSQAGTWAYMSPEQFTHAPLGPESDWFAVGTTLFHVLTGQLPPQRNTDGWFAHPLPPLRGQLPGVPDFVTEATLRLMSPDRDERMRAAEALSQALSAQVRVPVRGRRDVCRGRSSELRQLRGALSEARTGATLVQVSGRSGIGKSHLVRYFLGEVGTTLAPEALILQGRCSALESVPYKALDGVIDDLARQQRVLPEAIPGWEALLRLFPVLGRIHVPDDDADVPADPDELRQLGIAALAALLAAAGGGEPVVIWIDDLQWGDRDSLALLRVLLAAEGLPLLLVATYRTEDIGQSPVLRAIEAAPLADRARRVSLGPLSDADARALAVEQVGDDPERIALIVSEAKGSPFFIDALAREPSAVSLQGVVSRRLSALSDEAQELLQVAAVAAAPLSQPMVLAAAGQAPRHRPLLIDLQRQRLLRPTSIGQLPAVVVYHDRIRETVLDALPAPARTSIHQSLYAQLVTDTETDPEALLVHSRGAGRTADAARWAVAAAEQAQAALAFGRAAELLEEALALGAPEPTRLRIQLAEVLVYAQRGAEAPAHYLQAAAAVTDPGLGLDLRRRAAEQYIRNGRLDEGMAAFAALLAEIGVTLPSSPVIATAQIVWRRAMLKARGDRYTLTAAASVPDAVLRELDALFGASSGLGLVDPMTAAALALRHLALALRTGEPARLCQAFGYEATATAALGGASWRAHAAKYSDEAEAVAAAAGLGLDNHPEMIGYLGFVRCNVRWFTGDWRGSLGAGAEAARIFDRWVPGSRWHISATNHYILSCLTFLGRFPEVRARRDAELRAATRRGDRFGAGMMLLGDHNLVDIIDGRGPTVRAQAAELPSGWPVLAYHRAKFEVQLALHEGDPEQAWALLEAAWPKLRALQFLRLEMSGLLLWELRGRIAAARRSPRGDRDARAALKRLRAVTLPLATPLADLLASGLNPDRAEALRAQAAEGFEALGMVAHAQVARGEAAAPLQALLAPR